MRKIIHIDMDAFFASVEQRNNPELKGKPVIVGGDPDKRGVVAACSYEARKFGIHSAMASKLAQKLCPNAIFIKSNFGNYGEVSRQIREIFFKFTDLVEPLSLDEAYLDVTENKFNIRSATEIAETIRTMIFNETQLTASAGVSFNKFLAKMGSDVNKPNGICVITPKKAPYFIDQLPIGKFYGVGKSTEKRMKEYGIYFGRDIKRFTQDDLYNMFGKSGIYYYKIANCMDDREVKPTRIRKSIGKERTFQTDIIDINELMEKLKYIGEKVFEELKRKEVFGKTLTVKIKYDDFTQITRSHTESKIVDSWDKFHNTIYNLLKDSEVGKRKVRLLGVSVSSLNNENREDEEELHQQLYLFSEKDFE